MAETINMPKLGFDMAEGTLIRWLKKVDESVDKGELLAEIETDKATVEVESPAGGVLRKLLVDEGAVVPVGTPIAIVGTADEKIEETPVQKTAAKQAPSTQRPEPPPAVKDINVPIPTPLPEATAAGEKASPLAKRMARESNIDLSNVRGSGPGGRIVRRDIEAILAGGVKAEKEATVNQSRLRQAIARRMTESKTTIPHFYVAHEYKMEALLELRKQFNANLKDEEKLSVNDFIVRATALTLRQFPNLNASLRGTTVQRHGTINIGVAVSVEGGLLTVVCREADNKPLSQISAEVKSMAAHARAGKVHPEEIEGSTFSVSNLGMYDVENFQAIINPPEVAILAVGSARELPVVEEGTIKVGWRMKVSLAVDHRVSDGAEGARFLQALGVYLEEPLRLLM
jgi:pyruvate dehydrogenase E2 component (dihydrolipoamide acetyltransferase)